MKHLAKIATAAAMLAAPLGVWADDAHHPEKDAAAKPAAEMPAGMAGKGMAMAQDHMKRMMEQMDKIRQTQDPKEKDRLIEEHAQEMAKHMEMMQDMMGGGGMMGGDMMQHMHGSSADRAPMK